MDWATFLKDYAVLITAGAGLLGVVLTYIFTRSHYMRSRKWELEDRDYNRQTQLRDKNIQEVQEYINAYRKAATLLAENALGLIHTRNLEKSLQQYEEIEQSIDFTIEAMNSIFLLNDEELSKLSSRSK